VTADIKPYPAYKDSGVPWLGRVPEHWGLRSLRASANVEKGRLPRSLVERGRQPEGSVPYLSMNYLRSVGESPFEYAAYQPDLVLVDRGETILLWDGANAGEFLKAKPGAVSSTAARVRPRAVDQQFFFYACQQVEYTLRALTVGMGIPHVDGDVLKRLNVVIPPETEQAAIVRYLDHADRKVRHAIHARQQLIKLLTEQKQSVIQRAVTRGLDPNIHLKPSGLLWLGDVPKHWDVVKLRLLFQFTKGQRASEITNEYVGQHSGVFPVFSGQTENDGIMGMLSWHEFDCPIPVILVATVGAKAGTTRLVCGQFSLSQNCALMIPRRVETNAAFFEYALQRLIDSERASMPLIMQPSLRFLDLNRFAVPCPPACEQSAVVRYLDGATANLDKAIDAAHRGIDLLREYRTRLIADVVTGKLNVRGVKVPDDETDILPEGLEDIDDVDAADQGDDAAEGNSESSAEENT